MRLMIIVLVLAGLVIVDQSRFHGYYGSQVSEFVARTLRTVIWRQVTGRRSSPLLRSRLLPLVKTRGAGASCRRPGTSRRRGRSP